MFDTPPELEPEPQESEARRGPLLPAWSVAVACLALLAALLLPPVAEDRLAAMVDGPPEGVDAVVTGTVQAPHRRYTVHRSVLHPDGASCTMFANGRAHGAC